MSKPVRRFLSLLLVLQLIIPYSTFAAAVGEFTSVVGDVTQTRAKELITPVVKSPIEMKDLIATARTSSATMVFSDDSTITLSENTKLEIKEFLFKDQSRRGIFSLAIGKLTADVKKYIGGDNVFEVYSPTVGIGVRGTGFEFVEALQDGKVDSNMATVSCTDGSLNLSAFSDTGAVISTAVLEAGQMAVIIGGIITISMIGVAATAAIGAAGGTGTGTGGAAAAGGAATTTGLSTAAIAGIAIGGAVVVGGAAAAAGGGGGGGTTTPTPTPTPTPIAQCNQQQVAGTNTADTRTIELGKTSGTFRFYYNTYTVKDRIVLACYGSGTRLHDTGCVGTSATVSVPFSCSTSKITATVTPNCAGTSSTAWDYIVYCP
jgi:hypothetical protein